MARVAEVLNVLGNADLSLELQKCRFFAETMNKYLGHVIRPGRLGVAEKNTEALKAAPLTRTQTELRSFLGLCNVYRRFEPHFSAIAAPPNALLCKEMPPDLDRLSPEAIAAFQALCDRLLSPPVLALPRAVGQLWLDTDASDVQLVCCLLQRQPDWLTLPMGYWSRTLSAAEYLLDHREGVPGHCLGGHTLTTLPRSDGVHRSNRSPRPEMGHESIRRTGAARVMVAPACGIHLQG
jgi:RNase H-like domain found in reverse transcriptase